ncbi:MAG: glycosyltransferase family 4 protein [Bacteriovorax sp.]|jgi:glycosyltransferase involved in cell wall biosynthesis
MKKKVILITLEAPIPFGGAAARWYYILLNQLISRGHDVSVFSAVSNENDIEKIKQTFPGVNIKAFAFPKRSKIESKVNTILKPYSYMFSDEMQFEVNERLKEPYDVIHLEQLWTTWLIRGHEHKAFVSVHYLTNIDLEFAQPGSLKERMTIWLMQRTEKKLLSRMIYIKTCSQRIENKIREWLPSHKIKSIPFAIDKALYPFFENAERPLKKRITLVASMNWYPGKSAAIRLLNNLWPILSEKNPDCVLTIVGWQAKSVLSSYLNMKNVEILENVPDIQPYFTSSSILLYAPARGSGMKIKILEAMLLGVPVVTTSEGVEGLRLIDGLHAMIAEDDESLIEKAHSLLNNLDLQRSMRVAGRKIIEEECSPESIMNEIEKCYSFNFN